MAYTPKTPTGSATSANSTPVVIASDQAAVPVSGTVTANIGTIATLATAAKQPALGTAGTASADVLTVQGKAAMTPILVDGTATTQPVSGTVTANAGTGTMAVSLASVPSHAVTNAGTFAVQNDMVKVNGTATDTNSGVKSAGTLRVVLATDQPALTNKLLVTPDSVALPANQSVNVSQINAVTPLMGNGVTGTGSQRVTIASDNTAFSVNSTLSAETTKVIGVVRNADGAGNLFTSNSTTPTAKFSQDANITSILGTAPTTVGKLDMKGADGDVFVRQATGSNLHTVVDSGTVSTVTNLSQMGGVAIALNTGTRSTGTQRVTIATDDLVPTTLTPAATGGLSKFHLVSAATTNATSIKASAGQVYGWYIYNSNAAARKVAFHNTAGTPTAGTAVTDALVIPPGGAANVQFSMGIAFSTGIAITTVTDLTDAGTTAVALNDLVINIYYK